MTIPTCFFSLPLRQPIRFGRTTFRVASLSGDEATLFTLLNAHKVPGLTLELVFRSNWKTNPGIIRQAEQTLRFQVEHEQSATAAYTLALLAEQEMNCRIFALGMGHMLKCLSYSYRRKQVLETAKQAYHYLLMARELGRTAKKQLPFASNLERLIQAFEQGNAYLETEEMIRIRNDVALRLKIQESSGKMGKH